MAFDNSANFVFTGATQLWEKPKNISIYKYNRWNIWC